MSRPSCKLLLIFKHATFINVNLLLEFVHSSLEGYVAKEEMPLYLSNLFQAR